MDIMYVTPRDVELSNRIAARNMPSRPLQPQFSMRPVSTKYALLPIIDRRAPASVPIHKEPTYSVENVFNPGDAQAPWSGFATNVNDESSLRGMFFALQNCEQKEYVPSIVTCITLKRLVGKKSNSFLVCFKSRLLHHSIQTHAIR